MSAAPTPWLCMTFFDANCLGAMKVLGGAPVSQLKESEMDANQIKQSQKLQNPAAERSNNELNKLFFRGREGRDEKTIPEFGQ